CLRPRRGRPPARRGKQSTNDETRLARTSRRGAKPQAARGASGFAILLSQGHLLLASSLVAMSLSPAVVACFSFVTLSCEAFLRSSSLHSLPSQLIRASLATR